MLHHLDRAQPASLRVRLAAASELGRTGRAGPGRVRELRLVDPRAERAVRLAEVSRSLSGGLELLELTAESTVVAQAWVLFKALDERRGAQV